MTKQDNNKMTKDTDDLIASLAKDFEDKDEKRPMLACHRRKVIVWFSLAYALIYAGVIWIGPRHDIADVFSNTVLMLETTALFIAGLFGTIAAFQLSVPDEKIRPLTIGLMIVSASLILGLGGYCYFYSSGEDIARVLTMSVLPERLLNVVLIILVPLILMLVLLRKAAPVHASWAGFAAFLSVSALGVSGCRYTCPIDDPSANLIWHYIPIIMIAILGLALGKKLLRW